MRVLQVAAICRVRAAWFALIPSRAVCQRHAHNGILFQVTARVSRQERAWRTPANAGAARCWQARQCETVLRRVRRQWWQNGSQQARGATALVDGSTWQEEVIEAIYV